MKKYLIIFAAFLSLCFEGNAAAAPMKKGSNEAFLGLLLASSTDSLISEGIPLTRKSLEHRLSILPSAEHSRILLAHVGNLQKDPQILNFSHPILPLKNARRHLSLNLRSIDDERKAGRLTSIRIDEIRKELEDVILLLVRLSKAQKIQINGVEKLGAFMTLTLNIDQTGLDGHNRLLLQKFTPNPHISLMRITEGKQEELTFQTAKSAATGRKKEIGTSIWEDYFKYTQNLEQLDLRSPDFEKRHRDLKTDFEACINIHAGILREELDRQIRSNARDEKKSYNLVRIEKPSYAAHSPSSKIVGAEKPSYAAHSPSSPRKDAILRKMRTIFLNPSTDENRKKALDKYLGTLFAVDYPTGTYNKNLSSILPNGEAWEDIKRQIEQDLGMRPPIYIELSGEYISGNIDEFI